MNLRYFESCRQNQANQLGFNAEIAFNALKRECRNDKLLECVFAKMNADPGLGLTPKEGLESESKRMQSKGNFQKSDLFNLS